MLLYFLRGSLPWQGLTATDQTQKEERILEGKRRINAEDLCEGLPQQFAAYFDYIRSLDSDEKPKYSHLRKIFHDLFVREGFDYDHVYDRTILEYLRLSDQVLKLNPVTARPAPWNHLLQESRPPHSETACHHSVRSGSLHGGLDGFPIASASSSGTSVLQGKWNTTIRLPISTPSSLLPTFCSAIVARQYSLIIHAKVRGMTIKPFALEVPIQVIYPPPDSAHQFIATDGQTSMVSIQLLYVLRG